MLKKVFLVLIISILMLSISGCTDKVVEESLVDTGVVTNTISDDASSQSLMPIDDLSENYEFLGSRDLSAEKVGSEYISVEGIEGGSEGLYIYLNSTDLYIDVIEMNSSSSAEEFIVQYKAGFRELSSGSRFTEESISDHSTVRILEYVTIDKANIPRYTYIWSNDKFVFVVGGATDDYVVLSELAEATGY
ncbi:hypothetical protein [Methanolobus sp. ZRKC5]|uniref:hypothetical protein n=1 Tax=unclassified Methanolobus TaxID=2629569 RepID=UPI00313AB1D2